MDCTPLDWSDSMRPDLAPVALGFGENRNRPRRLARVSIEKFVYTVWCPNTYLADSHSDFVRTMD